MFRIRMTRFRAAAATALLSLSLAAPALADHDDWRDDGYGPRRGYPVHRHERSCDHDDRRGDRGGYYDRHESRWNGFRGRSHYGRDSRHRDEYGCRPCGRRFSREGTFHRHLSDSHGVPYRAIPRVLVFVDWGWLFLG